MGYSAIWHAPAAPRRESAAAWTLREAPFLGARVEKDLAWVVALTPVWILFGVKAFVFHAIVGLAVLKYALGGRRTRVPPAGFLLLLFTVSYAVSVVLNAATMPTERLPGTLHNLGTWLAGLAVLVIVANTGTATGLKRFAAAVTILGCIASVVAVTGVALWFLAGSEEVVLYSPLLDYLPDQLSQVRAFRSANKFTLLTSEWLGGPLPRSAAFFVYPNAYAGFALIAIPAALLWASVSRSPKLLLVLALVPLLVGLLITLSRTAWVALLVAVIATYAVHKRGRLGTWVLAMGALAALVALQVFLESATDLAVNLLEARATSTSTRVALWLEAFSLWRESPLFGIGHKPQVEAYRQTVGSHSTYLGLLLKTGFAGIALFLLFLAGLLKSWYRLSRNLAPVAPALSRFFGMSIVSLSLWMLTEDLDAPQVVPFVFFAVVGYMFAVARWDSEDLYAGVSHHGPRSGVPVSPSAVGSKTWRPSASATDDIAR
jgi:hypothetical protein